MVHFPPLPSWPYVFRPGYGGITHRGFPHSDIPGSKLVCSSPGRIAADRVLHRLLAPRHSPYALSSLTKCSLHLTALYVVKKTTDCRIFSCQKTFVDPKANKTLVENTGIEPVTSWLQTRRSPS